MHSHVFRLLKAAHYNQVQAIADLVEEAKAVELLVPVEKYHKYVALEARMLADALFRIIKPVVYIAALNGHKLNSPEVFRASFKFKPLGLHTTSSFHVVSGSTHRIQHRHKCSR